jgi:alpha-tubulin suppressor-like RCC1 family protein
MKTLLVLPSAILAALILPLTGLALAPQTITFPPIPDQLSTAGPITLDATTSSGLPVNYSLVSGGGVATILGDALTLTGSSGAVTVKASQSGNGTFDPAADAFATFTVVDSAQRFVKIASGGTHSMGIRADGTLWAWGGNSYGQLGLDDTNGRASPVQVGDATNWASVACGDYHTLAVRSDGTLWAWGRNTNGRLGLGDTNQRSYPEKVGSATNWASVACGSNFTMAVRSDGTLWAWGRNSDGQLGLGDTSQRTSPEQVGSATNWASVACGYTFTMAVRSNGTLWAWGWNFDGQLGLGDTDQRTSPEQVGSATNWASVACGDYHTVALRSDSTLWAWGANGLGQLGHGDTSGRTSPVQVGGATNWALIACGTDHTMVVRSDGTLWAWGANGFGQLGLGVQEDRTSPIQVGNATNWALVACGYQHTVAVRIEGSVWAWGNNGNGQLGVRAATDQTHPVRVGSLTNWALVGGGGTHTMAVRSDGTLWAWGVNSWGQLGLGDTTDRASPVQVGGATNWASVACGADYTHAVRSDGTLWAWGINGHGQLGLGDTSQRTSPVQVGSATNWASVAGGSDHTMAVRSDGTLWAWGRNANGRLGLGDTNPRTSPEQVGSATNWASIACGDSHTIAVRSDGTLWAWGANGVGQLGLGDFAQRTSPVQVGSATNWASVACGNLHTAAVSSDGTVWAWGSNDNGQLGLGDFVQRTSPVQVGSATNWASVACGYYHTVAVSSDASVWAWGGNSFGQLGLDDTNERASPVQVGSATNWAAVACGSYHTVAVRSDGTLWAWGSNGGGRLGNHDKTVPSRVWPQRESQTLAFPELNSLYDGQSVALGGSSSSGLPVTYKAVGPATISGSVLTPIGPGNLTVVAYQHGDTSWESAEPVQRLGFVSEASQEIGVQLGAPVFNALQGATAVAISVVRTGLASAEFEVTLETANGSVSMVPPIAAGMAGVDYVAQNTVVEFAAGEMSKEVIITLIPRTGTTVPNTRFVVTLSGPTGGAVLGVLESAQVRVLANDVVKPTLVVTSPQAPKAPAKSVKVSMEWPFVVSGTAGDARGMDRVEVVLNGGAPVAAVLGSTTLPVAVPFSLALEPENGLNTVVVTAYDLRGNSRSVTRNFVFTRRFTLAVARVVPLALMGTPDAAGTLLVTALPKTGSGTLLPEDALAQGTTVEPGTNVKLIAKPSLGYVFSHFLGLPSGAIEAGSMVQFTMPAAAVSGVTAEFVANPFLGLGEKPIFFGTIEPQGMTEEGNTTNGFVRAVLSSLTGAFSGTVRIEGVTQKMSGQVFGNGSVWFKLATGLQPELQFGGRTLTAELVAGKFQLSLETAAGLSEGQAEPVLYSNTVPVPGWMLIRKAKAKDAVNNQGYFTVSLPARAAVEAGIGDALTESEYPQGNGYMMLTVGASGQIRVTGVLADGTVVTGATGIVGTELECPLFAPLLTPGTTTKQIGGSLVGRLKFAEVGGENVTATGEGLKWFRLEVTELGAPAKAARIAATRLYTAGWPGGVRVGASGALYHNTWTVEQSLGLDPAVAPSGNALFAASHGKLAGPIAKTNLNITGNVVTKDPVGDPSYSVKFARKTGVMTGGFDPVAWEGGMSKAKALPAVRGVMVQGGMDAGAFGFFLSNALGDSDPESGPVSLTQPEAILDPF